MFETFHLLVIGYDEIVSNKYTECFYQAFLQNRIDGYPIIDLLSEQKDIEKRIGLQSFKPTNIYYLDNVTLPENIWFSEKYFGEIINNIVSVKKNIKVYISTEVKSHEKYLRFCLKKGIPSLTEKPIFAPITNGHFDIDKIPDIMKELLFYVNHSSVNHSVMSLSRYHPIYNDIVLKFAKEKALSLQTPITSIHLKHAGGVWNTHIEYDTREDHPYKYGYGMLMHGGYHYIDLVAQALFINKLLYPQKNFSLELCSFVAYPQDQNTRIGRKISSIFDDYLPNWRNQKSNYNYGETDITSTFCLKDKNTNSVITLGTISLEQTTPSVRNWKNIPENIYNKNGRTSSVDFEVQLSTLHSVKVHCYDVPVKNKKEIEKIDAIAKVTTRSNASFLPSEEYVTESTYTGIFHSNSNKNLMLSWLNNEDDRSTFQSHEIVMKLVYVIGKSIVEPGKPICIDLM